MARQATFLIRQIQRMGIYKNPTSEIDSLISRYNYHFLGLIGSRITVSFWNFQIYFKYAIMQTIEVCTINLLHEKHWVARAMKVKSVFANF